MLILRIRKLYSYRKVLFELSLKELKSQYSGSKLNIWWAVVNPLLLAFSINLIFVNAFKVDVPNYTFFVLSGIIPWMYFSNAILSTTSSFARNSSILKQGIFVPEVVVISTILSSFFVFLIGLVVLLPLFIVLKFKVLFTLLFLVLPIILQTFFIIGLGFFFLTWNIFSRDIQYFLFIGLMIWFWVTPVFYSVEMLPHPYRLISFLNPMSYFVILYRQIIFEGQLPSLVVLLQSFFFAFLFFFTGYLFFLKMEPEILKRI